MNPAIASIRKIWGGDSVEMPDFPDTIEQQPEEVIWLFAGLEYVKPTSEEAAKAKSQVATIAGIESQIESHRDAGNAFGQIFFWNPEENCIRAMAVEV